MPETDGQLWWALRAPFFRGGGNTLNLLHELEHTSYLHTSSGNYSEQRAWI